MTIAAFAVAAGSVVGGCAPGAGPPLLCDVGDDAELIAKYSPVVMPFACDPLDSPRRRLVPSPPVLVGRSDRDDVFVADQLAPLVLRLFAGGDGGTLALVHAQIVDEHIERRAATVVFEVLDGPIVGGAVRAPRVQADGGERTDFDRAVMSVFYDRMPEASDLAQVFELGEPLRPISDCTEPVARLPEVEQWWVPEYVLKGEHGDVLVVMRLFEHTDRISAHEYFVFYGPEGAIVQRDMPSLGRRKNGDATSKLEVDGAQMSVELTSECEMVSSGPECRAWLMRDGEVVGRLTPVESVERVASTAEYWCRHGLEPLAAVSVRGF